MARRLHGRVGIAVGLAGLAAEESTEVGALLVRAAGLDSVALRAPTSLNFERVVETMSGVKATKSLNGRARFAALQNTLDRSQIGDWR